MTCAQVFEEKLSDAVDRNVIRQSIMKNKLLVGVMVCICGGFLAVAVPEMSPKQTPAEIQTQKNLADQALLPGVPEASKTPLKLFEKYFAAVARMDASEFDYFTKRGIEDYFDETGDLTEEGRKRIAEGAKESGTGGHKLVGFWFHADSNKPSIVFGFMYFQKGKTSEPVWNHEEVKLNLIKTEQGWRIDKLTEVKAR